MTGHHAATSSYTTLESLLLFQSVIAVNNQTDAFKNISDALRRSTLLESHSPDADRDKFQPEALQDFYFQLLKDEAAKQVADNNNNNNNNTAHDAPNGIIASSEDAKLVDVEERQQLACDVVDKLYAQYKDQVIKEVREDEQRYDALVKELHELEEDEAKKKLEQVRPASQEVSTSTTTLDHNLNRDGALPQTQIEALPLRAEEKTPSSFPLRSSPSSDAQPSLADVKDTDTKQQQPFTTALDPVPPVATLPALAADKAITAPLSTQELPSASGTVKQAPQSLLSSTATSRLTRSPILSPSSSSSSGAAASAAAATAATAAPKQQSSLADLPSQDLTTPTNPPPTSLDHGAPSVQGQAAPIQQNAQPLSAHPPPALSQIAQPRSEDIGKYMAQTPVRPPYKTPAAPHTPVTAHPSVSMAQSQPQAQYYTQPSQRGGIELPPFSVNPQAPVTTHATLQETRPQPQPQLTAAAAPPSIPSSMPSTPTIPHGSILRVMRDLASYKSPRSSAAGTPVSSARGLGDRKPGTHISPGSTTRWKSTATPTTANASLSERARPRSISPISDTEGDQKEPPARRPGRPSSSSSAAAAAIGGGGTKASGNNKSTTTLKPPGRAQGRRASLRASSRTPSAAPTASGGNRTRSPSVASHADELSISDNAKVEAGLKNEAGAAEEENQRSKKRKRSMDHYDARVSPARHQLAPVVLAFRNFSRMAGPVINTITMHKHASMFMHPVKERDAEGYADIIKRPQDLKSIRGALSNGNRAVVAAQTQSAETAVSSPGGEMSVVSSAPAGGSSTTIQLAQTPELVPPKGIVNGAQLEQEIMRMFANAVMFNPGREGVVQDTREMFEEVEANLTSLRALERSSTAGGGGGGGGSSNAATANAATAAKEEDEEADELAGDSAGNATAATSAATAALTPAPASTSTLVSSSVRKRRA